MKVQARIFAFVLLILICPSMGLSAYFDVPESNPNYIAIQFLTDRGVIEGYPDGSYKPDQEVNRVESLKVVLISSGIDIPAFDGELGFSDTDNQAWYAAYIAAAKNLGIVNGNPDGTFAPDRNVVRAEFMKMLLISNDFSTEKWSNLQIFEDVPTGEWYAPYMNYAGQSGLIVKDQDNKLYPGQSLNRGEVAEILYIMTVILNGKDTQFLITQAESQLSQIDIYIADNNPESAKRASELAVDMTQQALDNLPEDSVVIGVAKLSRAYDFTVKAYIAAIAQNKTEATDWANQAITKATEAQEINPDTADVANHIKDRAKEILEQL